MGTTSWDPTLYARFAAERARPFHDLVGAIEASAPRDVVDLGCGPGTMTAHLSERWPEARVLGLDSSGEMVDEARRLARPGRLAFALGRIEDWLPEPGSVDVIVGNAVLQWIPDHVALFPRLVGALRPGGTFAFQVPPGDNPASAVLHAIATSHRWAGRLAHLATGTGPWSDRSPVRSAQTYLDELAALGTAVTAWETTYLHVLPGDDPVLEWFAGTALRPHFDALGDDERAIAELRAEIGAALREVYPRRAYGTVLPFRRIFVVAKLPRAAIPAAATPAGR